MYWNRKASLSVSFIKVQKKKVRNKPVLPYSDEWNAAKSRFKFINKSESEII